MKINYHLGTRLKSACFATYLLLFIGLGAKGQDMQSNPLSRLGFGTLQESVTGAWRSMGGVGIGVNDPTVINLKNPAGYAGTDSLSFLIDAGVSVNMGHFSDGTAKRTSFLGGLDYLALQFPLYKNIVGFSAGIKPFSSAGYGLTSTNPVSEGSRTVMLQTFTGSGSLQKAYAGLAVRLWGGLFVGANANYLFGSLTHSVATTPNSTVLSQSVLTNTIKMGNWGFDAGVQYRYELRNKEKDNLVFGVTYAPGLRINPIFTEVTSNNVNDPLRQTIKQREVQVETTMPHDIGAGFSWNRPGKYTLAADVSYAMWSKTVNVFTGDGVSLKDAYKAALGFEFIPDAYSRDYGKVMKYRFGLNYAGSYLATQGIDRMHNVGASFGIGMPVNFFGGDRPSIINLGLDYTHSFAGKGTPLTNDVLRLSLSVTFNETWFRELKIY